MVEIRAVLHDPAHPVADLYVLDKSGTAVKLDLSPGSLSSPQVTQTSNGSVLFYNKAAVDPKKPAENLAATVKVPAKVKSAIVILVPGPPNTAPAYRPVMIEDSSTGFPKGESRVLSLVPVETAIEAGEHKLPISPGKIVSVPAVKKLNEFNMAQTNFYYKDGAAWVTFTERQVQYLDSFRRIFIISATPGASQPLITTIVDTAPVQVPTKP